MITAKYQLEQVVAVGRHGIRTPLANTVRYLTQATAQRWPDWYYAPGYLTTKGGVQEAYLGHYFSLWLTQHGLLSSTELPQSADYFIYANSMQRTVNTAQFFTASAFAGCDIAVQHRYPIEKMDPLFDPTLTNLSATQLNQFAVDIEQYASLEQGVQALDQQLADSYALLETILDFKHSALYQTYQTDFCQLASVAKLQNGSEPQIEGILGLATAIVDAFLLQYYAGFPPEQIAWGKITGLSEWQKLVTIRNHYIDAVCAPPLLADYISRPLLNKVKQLFELSPSERPKFALLVGHDSNIAALLWRLGFSDYTLPEQVEKTPIGGKVLLQRWRNTQTQQPLFRAEYIYQSFSQLRHEQILSLTHPPMHYLLKHPHLTPYDDHFYCWQDFTSLCQQLTATGSSFK